MKYNRIFRSLLVVCMSAMVLPSCTDWLSVNPEDQILEDQAFENLQNIQITLNGLYLKMSDRDAYGFQMTSGTADILAQYYSIPSDATSYFWYYMKDYNYTEKATVDVLTRMWRKMYNLIMDTNFFMMKLEATKDLISSERKNILMGEAFAIRAYAHLDLLRMFGPVYSKYPEGLSIPYYREAKAQVQQRLPANEAIDEILKDIEQALHYLANDPVIIDGRMVGTEYRENFYTYRSWRLNYYAVKALKARTLMYAGQKDEAAALAEEILGEINDSDPEKALFPWVNPADLSNHLLRDYAFSTEALFGIHNYEMMDNYNNYFYVGIQQARYGMFSARTNVNFWFNVTDYTTSNDYRSFSWKAYQNAAYAGSIKYANEGAIAPDVHFYQPLIRKSELYYILAEARSDVFYLNEVRLHRGVTALSTYSVAELNRDCMAEYWGDGQLFFHYKRRNQTPIRRGDTGANLTMNDAKYHVPLPQAELNQ